MSGKATGKEGGMWFVRMVLGGVVTQLRYVLIILRKIR